VRRFRQGYRYGRDFLGDIQPALEPASTNSLEQYFDAHLTGPGLRKWRHYFPIYERHFNKFRGSEVHVVEIGVFSGGSLDMWSFYFGDKAHIYGVDIEPACRVYERPGIRIFTGDQSDPNFWQRFLREVPEVDIIIDDGGHLASQQIPTLEALLPHLRPGGVYLCEDLTLFNTFNEYISGFSRNLYGRVSITGDLAPNDFRRAFDSIHLYPAIVVIEKRLERLDKLIDSGSGTEWQPW
jgi:hypothetical protein